MSNIKEMDQNSWVCYRFGDHAYYYGEVGLLDQSGIVHSKDNAEMAANPKVQLVKHGFGVYIYDDPSGQSRYEGYWEKDKKSGKGTLYLNDGSKYDGNFRDGCYHDSGKMVWKNGDCYDGRWKKDRMEGPGIFKRNDGQSLKGSFKNNYYIDGNVLRNPFLPDSQYEKLKKARLDLIKQYEKNEKIKNGYFKRIDSGDFEQLQQLVAQSVKNNRVPLCVASEEAGIDLKAVKSELEKNGKVIKVIDLRKAYSASPEEKYNYIQEVTANVQECLRSGHLLVISLDDSEQVQEFQELFYPEIKQLYSTKGLNNQIWAPRDIRKPQIKEKIIGDDEVSEGFQIMVWSKVKYSQKINDDFLREKLHKRFESVMPIIKIDMIFCEKKAEEAAQVEDKEPA